MIDTSNLQKLFSKDSKYTKNRFADYKKARESVIADIKVCIKFWCNKHSSSLSSFSEWRTMVSTTDDCPSLGTTKKR